MSYSTCVISSQIALCASKTFITRANIHHVAIGAIAVHTRIGETVVNDDIAIDARVAINAGARVGIDGVVTLPNTNARTREAFVDIFSAIYATKAIKAGASVHVVAIGAGAIHARIRLAFIDLRFALVARVARNTIARVAVGAVHAKTSYTWAGCTLVYIDATVWTNKSIETDAIIRVDVIHTSLIDAWIGAAFINFVLTIQSSVAAITLTSECIGGR